MKFLAGLIFSIVALVVMVVSAAILFISTYDINQLKPLMADKFQEYTGRTLEIGGDISLEVYPNFHFAVSDVSISNPGGFTEANFLSVDTVNIGVKLMPLFEKKLEVSNITLKKPDVTLIALDNGRNNWTFETGGTAQENTATPEPVSENEETAQGLSFSVAAGEIKISDARLTYMDKAAGETLVLAPFNFTIDQIKENTFSQVAMAFQYNANDGDMKLAFDGKARIKPKLSDMSFDVRDVDVTADVVQQSGQNYALSFKTPYSTLDLSQETVALNDLILNANDQNIVGGMSIKGFSEPAIKGTFNTSQLDLAALLPAAETQSTKEAAAPQAPEDTVLIDVDRDALKGLFLNLKLSADTVKYDPYTLSNVDAGILLKDSVLRIAPLNFEIFDGTINSESNVDLKGYVPLLSISAAGESINTGDIVNSMAGDNYVTGVTDFQASLTAEGKTQADLTKTLGGQVSFNMGQGTITKWNLSKYLNQAIAYFKTGQLTPSNDNSFEFTSASGTFPIRQGVITNDDLKILAPASHLRGGGTVNLVKETVDYTLKAGLGNDEVALETEKVIPVRISGPFSAPKYAVDVKALLKAQYGEQIDAKKQELQQKADEKKEELKGKLNEKLKGKIGEQLGNDLMNALPF